MQETNDTAPQAAAQAWDAEYLRAGIPSSQRDEPSGVVEWALYNLRFLAKRPGGVALDLGCGKGRNTLALADAGFAATGFDFSARAIEIARNRPRSHQVEFYLQDVTKPLPVADSSVDLVLDIFVYFHQLSDAARTAHRAELGRVMKPGALLVISLATLEDEYYAGCPDLREPNGFSSLPLKWDPVAEVGNILPTREQLFAELSDHFEPEMTWWKRKVGPMHGGTYARETLAAVCRVKERL